MDNSTTSDIYSTLSTSLNSSTATSQNIQVISEEHVGLVVVIAVPVSAVVLVAALITVIACVYKRRRTRGSKIRVWQVSRADSQLKERATWHNGEAENNRGFNPDLKLQPSNIFTMPETLFNRENELPKDNVNYPNRLSVKVKESVVFDPSAQKFSIHGEVIKTKTSRNNVSDKTTEGFQHIGVNGDYNAVVQKSKEELTADTYDDDDDTDSVDDSAGVSIGVESDNVRPDQTGVSSTEESNSVDVTESTCGEYVAMTIDEAEEAKSYANTEIILSSEHEERNANKSNLNMIRVSSAEELPPSNATGQTIRSSKRVGSNTRTAVHRPPIAQPRLSKKKAFDPYDVPPKPRIATPTDINNKAETDQHSDNTSAARNERNPKFTYDYPRLQNQTSPKYAGNYDVPPTKYS